MHPACIAVLLAAIAAASAHAQPIWRCGDSYSQEPCADGKLVSAPPPPAAADRAQAAAAAARDARMADTLEKQRLQREAQLQHSAQATVLAADSTPELEGYKPPEKKATRKLDVFTASVPGSGKAAKGKKDQGGDKKSTAPKVAAINGVKAPALPATGKATKKDKQAKKA